VTGHLNVRPRIDIDPCRPSCPNGDCANCVRFDLGVAEDPELRPQTVLLDASIVRREGQRCGLFARVRVLPASLTRAPAPAHFPRPSELMR
jgi:hypothetical protein